MEKKKKESISINFLLTIIVLLGVLYVVTIVLAMNPQFNCDCIGGWNSGENITFKTPNDFCVQKGYEGGYFGSSTDLQKPLITCYTHREDGWTKYDAFEFGELIN
jgi:hypothetical protein